MMRRSGSQGCAEIAGQGHALAVQQQLLLKQWVQYQQVDLVRGQQLGQGIGVEAQHRRQVGRGHFIPGDR